MLDPFVFERYLRLKIITQSICYKVKKKKLESKVKNARKIDDKEVQAVESPVRTKVNKKLRREEEKLFARQK